MTVEKQANQEVNLYIPSILGLLLVVIAAVIVWAGQARPAGMEQTGAEPAAVPSSRQASKGDPAAGQTLFVGTCSACHGPTGEGIQGLGKNLVTSEFVAGQTDDQLIGFIKVGRGPTDPLNTTGIAMPPKGGNPALNDTDLENIVAYMRSIHK